MDMEKTSTQQSEQTTESVDDIKETSVTTSVKKSPRPQAPHQKKYRVVHDALSVKGLSSPSDS